VVARKDGSYVSTITNVHRLLDAPPGNLLRRNWTVGDCAPHHAWFNDAGQKARTDIIIASP
jgi:hypothetical protein